MYGITINFLDVNRQRTATIFFFSFLIYIHTFNTSFGLHGILEILEEASFSQAVTDIYILNVP